MGFWSFIVRSVSSIFIFNDQPDCIFVGLLIDNDAGKLDGKYIGIYQVPSDRFRYFWYLHLVCVVRWVPWKQILDGDGHSVADQQVPLRWTSVEDKEAALGSGCGTVVRWFQWKPQPALGVGFWSCFSHSKVSSPVVYTFANISGLLNGMTQLVSWVLLTASFLMDLNP
jgi:hypothetical protein